MGAVLVAYATKYGSTREVAEALVDVLAEYDVEAELRAAGKVRSLDGVSAVVLGGALYFFRWHRDARKFLARHETELKTLPVGIFAMGPFNDTPEEFRGARQQLDRAVSKFSWLTPKTVAVFGGRFDPTGLRFPHANPAMRKMPASDIRDWDAIRVWAAGLPKALGLAP